MFRGAFLLPRSKEGKRNYKGGGVYVMAKGKYEKWLTKEGLLLIEGWARDGLIDTQIAANMGIKRQTLYEWAKRYPDISDTLKKGKEVVDLQVENALLKRAIGYKYTETTRERIVDTGQKQRHGGESELTEEEWEFVNMYFNGKCCYCGNYAKMTKDHVKPLNTGGTLTVDNVIPCCKSCNSSKKDNEMLSWYQAQPFYDKYRVQKIFDYIEFVNCMGTQQEEKAELVVTKTVEKEVVPDTTAQIFWLKNRRPDKWRDKRDIETQNESQGNIDRLSDSLNQARKEIYHD